jgi:hypothetical protein
LGVVPCAQHMAMFVAVIFGWYGGPSSTSMAVACLIHCQSSTQLGCQMVRPRCPRGGWWLDLFVGGEPTSNSLSDFGGDAWRSPAFGSGGTHVLDCFLFFTARVFFVIEKALSLNSWFFRASVLKGLLANCTCHVLHQ